MVVHHVEVQEVGAGGDHRAHFLAEPREVGGQERRRDQVVGHGSIIDSGNCRVDQRWQTNGKYEHRGRAVKTAYLADQSDPSRNQYVFAYTITITNTGDVAAQLVSRHWIITDAEHQVQEVKGAGVVGQQPLLQPGESFEYTSGTSLQTAVGTMRGTYQMVAEDGHAFDARHPAVHAFRAAHAALGLPCRDPRRPVVVARRLAALAAPWSTDDRDGDQQRDQRFEEDPFHLVPLPSFLVTRAPRAPRHC